MTEQNRTAYKIGRALGWLIAGAFVAVVVVAVVVCVVVLIRAMGRAL